MRLLLYLLGAYDTIKDEPVGEDEYVEVQQRQAMKDAVRTVCSTGQVPKSMIRAIVIAVCSALSRAMDDNDDDRSEPDDAWMSQVMSLISDVLAWVIVLYEQYPALFTLCVQVALLAIVFTCFGMCRIRAVHLQHHQRRLYLLCQCVRPLVVS